MMTTKLKFLLDQHMLWLASQAKEGSQLTLFDPDFRGVDLNGLNLSEAIIPGANFAGTELSNIDFYACNLASADFSGAVLTHVDLTKANLDNGDLTNTKVVGGSWFRATCIDAKVAGLTFSRTNLERTYPDLENRV